MNKNEEDYYSTEFCWDIEKFISKVKELVDLSQNIKKKNDWIYRGQKNSQYELETSFERACNRFKIESNKRVRIENNMIREFKRRLHHYTSNIPNDHAIDEWLALMQHYGSPTRLLDFTYSPYVAAYFAFEKAEEYVSVAVWAINVIWFRKKLKEISRLIDERYEEYRKSRERNLKNFDLIFRRSEPIKLMLPINPFRLNERLAYQRGIFLCPGDIRDSFVENLKVYGNKHEMRQNIIKFVIPTLRSNKNTKNAINILDSMNISQTTLFPGLDGFARSFETRMPGLFMTQHFEGRDNE